MNDVVFEPRFVGGAIRPPRKKIAVQRGRAIAAIRQATVRFKCMAGHSGYGFVNHHIVEYESLIAEPRILDPDAPPSRATVEALGGTLKTLSRVLADRIRGAGHGAPDHARQRGGEATGHRDVGAAAPAGIAPFLRPYVTWLTNNGEPSIHAAFEYPKSYRIRIYGDFLGRLAWES